VRLIIAGGGTGGHIFSAIAIAEEFSDRSANNSVLFVGNKSGIEGRILPEEGWPVRFVRSGGVKGKGIIGTMRGLIEMTIGAFQSIGIIRSFRPELILGVGGYVSAPVVVAGRLLGRKTVIHEQNFVPGLTNRLLGKVVNRVFLTYPESSGFFSRSKVEVTGNPVRRAILSSVKGLDADKKAGDIFTVLVFGGSRGARRINDAAVGAFCGVAKNSIGNLKIIHQTGGDDCEPVKRRYDAAGVDAEVSVFIADMAAAYNAADLVISRAGATSIAEIQAAGKPSILVPYPFAADDHQRLNAMALVKEGAARMIADSDLTPETMIRGIEYFYSDRKRLLEMGRSARKMARVDAAESICDGLDRMMGNR